MMQLEEELNTPLLLRSVRGVQVTDAGLIFLRHAQAILKQIDNARASVLGSTASLRGPVAIGIPNSTGAVIASAILERVRHDHSDVQLSIIEAHSGQLSQMLSSGRLDFSFLYHSNFLHGFEIETLLSEPLCLLAPASTKIPGHRKGSRSVSLESLVQVPLILPGRANATRLLLEEACKRRGLEMQVIAEVASLDTLRESVSTGLGSTVLTAANIAKLQGIDRATQGALVVEPRIERKLVLARSRDFPSTQAAEATYSLARDIVVKLAASGKWPGARLTGPA